MNTYFIGCIHLGHRSMANHRGFNDEWEHDDYLIKQWNSVVKSPKDIVYILGDITMETSEHYYKLDQLNGTKHVILGNHDLRKHVKQLLEYVETVGGAVKWKQFGKKYMLTHIPIHPNEAHFYEANLHCHIHHVNKLEEVIVHDSYTDKDSTLQPTLHKYINVDAKLLDYKPRTIEWLLENRDKL